MSKADSVQSFINPLYLCYLMFNFSGIAYHRMFKSALPFRALYACPEWYIFGDPSNSRGVVLPSPHGKIQRNWFIVTLAQRTTMGTGIRCYCLNCCSTKELWPTTAWYAQWKSLWKVFIWEKKNPGNTKHFQRFWFCIIYGNI